MAECPQPLPWDDPSLPARLLEAGSRVLLFGAMGTGKSTLAARLGEALAQRLRRPLCIGADPGSPAFGVPGAVCLGDWHDTGWRCIRLAPLCTLDAGRFRLPLAQAVARLAGEAGDDPLIVDAPGVVRGVAGAELLQALCEATAVHSVVMLTRKGEPVPLLRELQAWRGATFLVSAAPAARRPSQAERVDQRTRLWDGWLRGAEVRELTLERLALVGTAPPADVEDAWRGRQIALLHGAEGIRMGEVERLRGGRLTVRLASRNAGAVGDASQTVLVRDAVRDGRGRLVTAPPVGRLPAEQLPSAAPAPRGRPASHPASHPASLSAKVGTLTLNLANGVFGDPLLELRLANRRRGLLFDLGDASALSPKALHRVEAAFVSHAHLDHIGGFVSLLRARLSGGLPPCRIYGPGGIHDHVAAFVNGFRWDRIGDAGPEFRVAELEDDVLRWTRIQPGRAPQPLESQPIRDGVLLEGRDMTVRCVELDHRIPVLAYALTLADTVRVRKERLAALGLGTGRWIAELKAHFAAGRMNAEVTLPDGHRASVEGLGETLVEHTAGTKLVYATDLADTSSNRRALAGLARGADLLVCESTFRNADRDRALKTQHLTTRACAEIALAAGAARLLPMHFSRRYAHEPWAVYDELLEVCRGTPLEHHVLGAQRRPPPA